MPFGRRNPMPNTRSNYERCEQAKEKLQQQCLTPAQYEKAIRELARRFRI